MHIQIKKTKYGTSKQSNLFNQQVSTFSFRTLALSFSFSLFVSDDLSASSETIPFSSLHSLLTKSKTTIRNCISKSALVVLFYNYSIPNCYCFYRWMSLFRCLNRNILRKQIFWYKRVNEKYILSGKKSLSTTLTRKFHKI